MPCCSLAAARLAALTAALLPQLPAGGVFLPAAAHHVMPQKLSAPAHGAARIRQRQELDLHADSMTFLDV
jgi:hypothetical protein